MNLLLILTKPPNHPLSWQAAELAKTACEQENADTQLRVFFYQDAVTVANRFTWQPADQPSLQHAWQKLSAKGKLDMPVCVSAALARGVTDADNAKRHDLRQTTGELAHNLADGFTLVGLGELAEAAYWADVIQTDAVIFNNASDVPNGQSSSHQSAKKILVLLDNPNRLSLEEGISAAMVMASFDHHVQLALTEQTACTLENDTSKAYKMLTSLALYDMPPLWVVYDHAEPTQPNTDISVELMTTQKLEETSNDFDAVLTL